MVHRREIDGREIVLGNHGALWGNAMTWFDHETGSVWSQPIGEAIAGPLKGTTLELLPSTLTEWGDWQEAHPDSFALDAPSNLSGFDLEQMVIVVELNQESVAFPIPLVRAEGVANGTIGGDGDGDGGGGGADAVPVAVTVEPDGDNWAVFSRTLDDDRVVELRLEEGVLVDAAGGERVNGDAVSADRWDPVTGLGIDGTDQNLNLLPGFTSFPSDYNTFFPKGGVWEPT